MLCLDLNRHPSHWERQFTYPLYLLFMTHFSPPTPYICFRKTLCTYWFSDVVLASEEPTKERLCLELNQEEYNSNENKKNALPSKLDLPFKTLPKSFFSMIFPLWDTYYLPAAQWYLTARYFVRGRGYVFFDRYSQPSIFPNHNFCRPAPTGWKKNTLISVLTRLLT